MERGKDQVKIRPEDVALIMQRVEEGLERGFKYLGWETVAGVISTNKLYCIDSKAVADNFCWDPHASHNPSNAVVISTFHQRLTDELKRLASAGESPSFIRISLVGIEKANPLDSQYQKNYLELVQKLRDVDPWNEINHLVADGMRNNSEFQIPMEAKVFGEPFGLRLHFKQNNAGWFNFDYFHVTGMPIEHKEVGGFHSMLVEEKFRTVDFDINNFNLINLNKRGEALGMMDTLKRYPEGKGIHEQLFLKYAPEMLGVPRGETEAKINAARRTETFFVRPGFIITTEQACNLVAGRPIFHMVPEKYGQESAWFVLDPLHRDSKGNSLLLQFGDAHNFDLVQTLRDLPLAVKKGKEFNYVVLSLANGHEARATIKLKGKFTDVRLLANPLEGKVDILGSNRKPLLLPNKTAVIERRTSTNARNIGVVYAYDSSLKRRRYEFNKPVQNLHEITNTKRKERIEDWLNTDEEINKGKRHKK